MRLNKGMEGMVSCGCPNIVEYERREGLEDGIEEEEEEEEEYSVDDEADDE